MTTKPSYIGVLNAIANGERGGHELFQAWSGATSDKKLKKTLDMVAIREMEHSWAFEKRLCELGFSLRPSADEKARKALDKRIKKLKSNASDEEKFALFGVRGLPKKPSKKSAKKTARQPAEDALLKILADRSIDPATGALMGRFICEERDTGVQLTKAFKSMQKRQAKG